MLGRQSDQLGINSCTQKENHLGILMVLAMALEMVLEQTRLWNLSPQI